MWRRIANADSYRYGNGNGNGNGNGYGYHDSNTYGYGNGYGYHDSNTYGNCDAYGYGGAEANTDTQTAPDASSSSISYSVWTVRFGELVSEPREFLHRCGVSASDA